MSLRALREVGQRFAPAAAGLSGVGMSIRAYVCAAALAALAATGGQRLAAQPALGPDWKALEAETLRHFQAIVRLDTQNPPGNEYLVTDYVKSVLEKEGIPVNVSNGNKKKIRS